MSKVTREVELTKVNINFNWRFTFAQIEDGQNTHYELRVHEGDKCLPIMTYKVLGAAKMSTKQCITRFLHANVDLNAEEKQMEANKILKEVFQTWKKSIGRQPRKQN